MSQPLLVYVGTFIKKTAGVRLQCSLPLMQQKVLLKCFKVIKLKLIFQNTAE